MKFAFRSENNWRRYFFIVAWIAAGAALLSCATARKSGAAYGLNSRVASKAYLQMPERASGEIPRRLSETGAFKDTPRLVPNDTLIPYDLIVSFWSDGAAKSRWISVPAGKIKFAPTGEWVFPKGTVFVKHFELATDETHPEIKRLLETRLLVCDANGGVYGVSYKWRADNRDADLLETNLTEAIAIKTATGTRTQTWYYPSRQDCLTCHTANAGYVLGVKTRQLNRDYVYRTSVTDNELRAWNHLGLFETNLDETALENFPKLARTDDVTRTLEDRARSYLDANCAHCHRPHGTVAYFDARYDTPLARNTIDEPGMKLLRQWIESLPGPPTLPPPEISPRGGKFDRPVTVTLKSEPGAEIRFTLDGTVPTPSDLRYEKPVQLTGPAILRAKAFKPGFTKSITVQEIYLVGE